MSKDIRKLVKRQLPIIDAVNIKSTWYALRMTPLGKYTGIELREFIQTITDTFVFTKEMSKKDKEHYHCVINTELDDEELREKIRTFLKSKFKDPPKRGDANKQYNLSECVDEETSVVYILKDGGEFISNNFDVEGLNKLRSKSYVKPDTKEFTERLNEIKDKVRQGEIRKLGDIMEAIVKLKALYRQPVNMNYIYQISLSLYLNVNPEEAEAYVQNFLSRLS